MNTYLFPGFSIQSQFRVIRVAHFKSGRGTYIINAHIFRRLLQFHGRKTNIEPRNLIGKELKFIVQVRRFNSLEYE